MYIITFFLWFTIHLVSTKTQLVNKGKYAVIVDRIEDCVGFNNALGPMEVEYTFGPFNRTHKSLTGNLTLPSIFDESYNLRIEIRKWGDGGWKKTPLKVKQDNACKTLQFYLNPIFVTLLKKANIQPKCPIQPGRYGITNYIIPRVFNYPMFKGNICLVLDVKRINVRHLCVQAFVTISEILQYK